MSLKLQDPTEKRHQRHQPSCLTGQNLCLSWRKHHKATGFLVGPRPSTSDIPSQLVHDVPSTHYLQANMDQASLTHLFLIPHQLPAFVRTSIPCSFRSPITPPHACSLICPGVRTVSQKAFLPVLEMSVIPHPTTFVLCVCPLLDALPQYGRLLQCGETLEERWGSQRVSHMEGRLGSFQTIRVEGHCWPLLGDPTVSSRAEVH